jgi:CubicO group peptidase (beta-lactamase class C family)
MTNLRDVFQPYVSNGTAPGMVGLVARGDQVEVLALGSTDLEGTQPMARETIFRVASLTKPITAAATMMLVDDGLIRLNDTVDQWLPEIAHPTVVRTLQSPLDDVVPAARPITVADLLTFRAGYGFPSDFSLPVVQVQFQGAFMWGRDPKTLPTPDEWMTLIAGLPMVAQPGEMWLYNMCSDILGVLIARVSGRSLPDFLEERIFEPLGMVDTAFAVPPEKRDRVGNFYVTGADGALELNDTPDGNWSAMPNFPSGAGGLVSTVDDLYAFGRMLNDGGALDGRRVLSPDSVRQITTDYLTAEQRAASQLFLEGQGWGFGGSVDVAMIDPWNVPGRYGWVGGSGTAAHVVPSSGAVTILLTQVSLTGPTPTPLMRDFWRYAALE